MYNYLLKWFFLRNFNKLIFNEEIQINQLYMYIQM